MNRTGMCLMAVLAFLTVPTTAQASDLERIRAAGKLVVRCLPQQDNDFIRVRTDAGPMPEAGGIGHFEGIDVEILQHAAQALGVELEIRPVDEPELASVFEALRSHEGDVGAASLTITEQRQTRVDFSSPYVPVHSVVIVTDDSTLAKPADLEGRRAAVMPNSSHHERLQRMGFTPEQLDTADFTISMLVAVQEGEVDFTLVDAFRADGQVPLPRGLRTAFVLPGEDGIGLAVRPGSDLRAHLDKTIESLRTSGELAAIFDRHASWLED